MTVLIPILIAALGTLVAALGGFLIGRWWQRRRDAAWAEEANAHVQRILEQITDKLPIDDHLARTIDPVAHGGRVALGEVLTSLRDYGGYEAVVLADDAGLVIAASGSEDVAELIAVEAAAFASAADRVPGQRQTILHTQPEKRWTLHRYFRVEGSALSLSASRQGATPRAEALDGALGAVQRVLGTGANGVAA